ncbi:putative cinnamyl alcohol dehydrogenase 4 [Phalaenopsis equestris]|uniref:putative cinnamyl alcohol dehydrogenase 4 n=1 Tax=Phalaenopsis equestris TaxID=78828 RepID=UPI0009E2A587|nr:putative cinnamyl alcohol dehydrogenase 4 [Phalaenopsis equestris]XP_020595518.1 putative cinnamyl alcohol dehydrogenase 4 [Phalaenopsis equestris]
MASEGGEGNCIGWAARDASGVLSPYRFNRRSLGDDDISIKITQCGVCYADVIWTRNRHHDSNYPLVPGHEIIGIVTDAGAGVTCFKTGNVVGVGAYVNSCRECEYCNAYTEPHCAKGATMTFNSIDIDGSFTKGGYSSYIVVHQRYCFLIPQGYPPAMAAPLLCAGITVYSPMKYYNMNQPGKSLGVIGLGGLGHLAIKFAKSFGLNVIVFSTSASKEEEAIHLLGADRFVISSDKQQMQSFTKSLDFIIDTASGNHPLDAFVSLLKPRGVLVIVGDIEVKLKSVDLIHGSKAIAASTVGGTKDIQEMLQFCAANKIYPEIEIIEIQYINEALERLVNRDVKYRFVIDVENSLK